MKELNIRNFDGTQPDVSAKEQKRVRIETQNGIGGLLEKHRDYIDRDTTDTGATQMRLDLVAETPEGQIKLGISRTPGGATLTDQIGQVQVGFDNTDDQRELTSHVYAPDDKGTVRRRDIDMQTMVAGDQIEMVQVTNTRTGEVTHQVADPATVVALFVERAKRAKENVETEQQLGVNNQPVELSEIRSLFAIAENADIPVVTGQDLDKAIKKRAEFGPAVDDEEAAEAARLFTEVVDTALTRQADNLVTDSEGVIWREGTQYEEKNARWVTEVGKASTDSETQTPFVAAQWRNEHPDQRHTVTMNVELAEGRVYGSTERVSQVVLRPGSLHSSSDKLETLLGVDDVRQVRNFLKDRKPS